MHYDLRKSHGPVEDDETIIFVVLENDHVDESGKLTLEAFPSNRLKKREASIARCKYTTDEELNRNVICPALKRGDTFRGLCLAITSSVRAIPCRHPVTNTKVRGLCVLDLVELSSDRADADDHGVITFSEALGEHLKDLKPAAVGRARENIRAALAEVFSAVIGLTDPDCYRVEQNSSASVAKSIY